MNKKLLVLLGLVCASLVGCNERAPRQALTEDQCVIEGKTRLYNARYYGLSPSLAVEFPECNTPSVYRRIADSKRPTDG